MRHFHYLVALFLVLLFTSITFAGDCSSVYFKSVGCSDLNANFNTSLYTYLRSDNNGWTATGALDWNKTGFAYLDLNTNQAATWRFFGDVTDSTGNGHNGSWASGGSFTTGKWFQPAATFNGTSDYIKVPDSSAFSFGNGSTDSPFSISGWFYFNATADSAFVSKGAPGKYEYVFFTGSGSVPILYLYSLGTTSFIGRYRNVPLTTGWHYIVATYDGSKTATGINIYVDNNNSALVTDSSGSYTAMNNYDANVLIGRFWEHSAAQHFNGKMQNLSFWNKALSASDVNALYYAQGNPIDSNLRVYYNFEQANGTSVVDFNDYFNGVLTNGATLSAQGMWDTNAAFFDNSNDSIVQSTLLDVVPAKWSISLWFNPNSLENYDYITSKRQTVNESYIAIITLYATGELSFFNGNQGTYWSIVSNPGTIKVGNWYHVVGDFNGTHYVLYLNGKQIGAVAGTPVENGTYSDFGIGNRIFVNDGFFSGRIDEFKFYDRALSDAEVQADYNSFLTAKFDANTNSIISAPIARRWDSIKIDENLYYDFGKQLEDRNSNTRKTNQLDVNSTVYSQLFDANVIGLWHLNNLTDSSGNGHDLNNANNATPKAGLWDTNGYETGVKSSTRYDLQVSQPSTAFNFTNGSGQDTAFTVSVWAKNNNPATTTYLYNNYMAAGNWRLVNEAGWYVMCLYGSGGTYLCRYYNPYATDVALMPYGVWHMLTATYDGSETSAGIKLYIDGVAVPTTDGSSGGYTGFAAGANNLYIGYGNTSVDNNVVIDEAALWGRNLSAAEIKLLYESQAGNFSEPNLVGLWHLNGDATDKSGNGNNGTINGASVTSGLWDSNAYSFDGVSNDILIPNNSQFAGGDMTVSAWIKTTDTVGEIFNNFQTASPYVGFAFNVGSGTGPGKLSFYAATNSASEGFQPTSGGRDINDGRWHHVAVTMNGTTQTIYVDGTVDTTYTRSQLVGNSTNTYKIGEDNNPSPSRNFAGSIEEVGLWSKALTADQIRDLYRKGVSRLDLNVYTCTSTACTTPTSSQYITDANNNTSMALSLSNSQYLGYSAFFKPVRDIADYNAGRFFTMPFLSSVEVSSSNANAVPAVTFNSLEGNALTGTTPFFSYAADRNLVVDFNVQDNDGDPLDVNIYYLSSLIDNGTLISATHLDTNYCVSTTWSSSSVQCDINFLPTLIPDGNYYLKVTVADSFPASASVTSTSKFGIDNTAPTLTVSNGGTDWNRAPTFSLTCTDSGAGCATKYYRINGGTWQTYSSTLSFLGDGNYTIDLNGVDNKSNVFSSAQTYNVLAGFNGSLHTHNDSNTPESYFAQGEVTRLVFDVNVGIAPKVTITDANGTTIISLAQMLKLDENTPLRAGDINSYYYDFNLPSTVGWLDVVVQNQRFAKAFYRAPLWTTQYAASDGNAFPFSFDLNVSESSVVARWLAPVDVNVPFIYGASTNSVRVLDFNSDTNEYKEIPSQVYAPVPSVGTAYSGHVVFLSTIDTGATKRYYISYSPVSLPKTYTSDLNITQTGFLYDINTSAYATVLDINQGGELTYLRSKAGTRTDLNSGPLTLTSPDATIQGTSYDITSITNPAFSVDVNGLLVKKITVRGTRAYLGFNLYDYNTTYTFYAGSPYILQDINFTTITPSSSYTYYDSLSKFTSSKFSSMAVDDNGTLTTSLTTDALPTLVDANYIAAYNPYTIDGVAQLFFDKNGSIALTPALTKVNLAGLLSFRRSIVTSDTLVQGDSFNSHTALLVFNPARKAIDLNARFVALRNPLITTVGATTTDDNGDGPSLFSTSYTPPDVNNLQDLNCFTGVTDDTIVDYVFIHATGAGLDVNETDSIGTASGGASLIIDNNSIYGGIITCSFYAVDVAGNSSSTVDINIPVSDISAPLIDSVQNTPDGNAAIDPDSVITVDANITEFTGVHDVNLVYRKLGTDGNWMSWDTNTMLLANTYSAVSFGYEATFTATEGTWQYYISASDVNGNDANSFSSVKTLYAFTDYTWTIAPASGGFGTKSGSLGSLITVGTVTLANTGDVALTFKLKSDWDTKYSTIGVDGIQYNSNDETTNGYQFTMNAGDTNTFVVTLGAKAIQRQDSLTITADPTASLATPDTNTITATIISFENGPFLYLEWLEKDSAATQGDTNVYYLMRITNLGNDDANTLSLDWNYPSGWIVTSGATSTSDLNLGYLDDPITNAIAFTVPSNATTGNQTVTFTASCCSDTNRTNTLSTTTVVTAHSSGGGSDTGGGSSGSGGTGGSGGSGSSPFIQPAQKDLFFQTNEFYELVRGQDSSFPIKVTNPLNGPLTNVHLSVTGIVSSYLKLEKDTIDSLDANQEFTTNIAITSPKYFTPGEYALTFTITGTFTDSYHRPTQFKEERQINLLIHDTNEATAKQYLLDMNGFIADLSARNFKLSTLPELLLQSNALFKSHDFDGVKKNYDEAKNIYELALEANAKSKDISGLVGLSSSNGISTPNTDRLLALAQLAFQRGDYALALSRLKEAELTYSLETKGEFNLGVWILANLDKVAVMTILLAIATYLLYAGVKLILIKRKLKDLNSENNLLLGLIQDLQKRTFVENKIGMGEYYDALAQFENRIASISEDIIDYTSKKNNTMKFSSSVTRLGQEKRSLLEIIRDTQEQYFNKGLVETRIYRTKVNSLTKRLSQVEEELVSNELEKTIRVHAAGPAKYFWRAYYKLFK